MSTLCVCVGGGVLVYVYTCVCVCVCVGGVLVCEVCGWGLVGC